MIALAERTVVHQPNVMRLPDTEIVGIFVLGKREHDCFGTVGRLLAALSSLLA